MIYILYLKTVILLIEIRKKSIIPIYIAAAVWFIYCCFFPLYRTVHFVLLVALSLASYLISAKLIPDKIEYVEKPEEPVSTGDEQIDALYNEGREAVAEMRRLKDSIKEPEIQEKIGRIIDVTVKIFDDLLSDPSDYSKIKRFSSYYLPTTLKLLNSYEHLSAQGIDGENISTSLEKISGILDAATAAYEKLLDSLFAKQALDIETDITVMESMLKREGLSGNDF